MKGLSFYLIILALNSLMDGIGQSDGLNRDPINSLKYSGISIQEPYFLSKIEVCHHFIFEFMNFHHMKCIIF